MVKKATAESVAVTKFDAMQQFITENKITGLQAVEVEGGSKIFQTRLMVAGQPLPMFIVLNDSVYNFVQVHLVTVTPEQMDKCLEELNTLNTNFSMLKYGISKTGNITLTCSVPSGIQNFDPGLVIALVDQVQQHLEQNYAALMEKIVEK